MPKFTLFWLVTYCLGIIATFVNPVFGTFTYIFEYYLRPSLHWWGRGFLPDLRWNFTIAAVLTVLYLVRRGSLAKIGQAPRGPARCLIALALLMVLVTPFAVNPDRSWTAATQYFKLILFHGLLVGTVRSERAFDAFIALHMAGAGWWGWEAYQNPKREESRLAEVGSGDTLSDNFAAAHLLTVIPFIAVYLIVHKDKKLKALAGLVAPFVINTFILCNSRGATVGLLVAAAATSLVARTGHRLRMVGTSIGMALAFYVLADPEFIARQQSTTSYQDDTSANERLASWSGGMEIVKDYPIGAGGNGYEELSPTYISAIVDAHDGQQRAPHNTYVLVATDWGVLGLALFLGYYASIFQLTRQVRKRAPEGGMWYYRALAIEVSVVGLMAASLFSDRLYAEAPFWMGGLAVVLHRLQTHTLLQGVKSSDDEPTPASVVPPQVFVPQRWVFGADR